MLFPDRPVERPGGEEDLPAADGAAGAAGVEELVRQLTEEEAFIIFSLPQELRESEVRFLKAQDQEIRNLWIRQPAFQRKQAAARRTYVRRAEAGREESQRGQP